MNILAPSNISARMVRYLKSSTSHFFTMEDGVGMVVRVGGKGSYFNGTSRLASESSDRTRARVWDLVGRTCSPKDDTRTNGNHEGYVNGTGLYPSGIGIGKRDEERRPEGGECVGLRGGDREASRSEGGEIGKESVVGPSAPDPSMRGNRLRPRTPGPNTRGRVISHRFQRDKGIGGNGGRPIAVPGKEEAEARAEVGVALSDDGGKGERDGAKGNRKRHKAERVIHGHTGEETCIISSSDGDLCIRDAGQDTGHKLNPAGSFDPSPLGDPINSAKRG